MSSTWRIIFIFIVVLFIGFALALSTDNIPGRSGSVPIQQQIKSIDIMIGNSFKSIKDFFKHFFIDLKSI